MFFGFNIKQKKNFLIKKSYVRYQKDRKQKLIIWTILNSNKLVKKIMNIESLGSKNIKEKYLKIKIN